MATHLARSVSSPRTQHRHPVGDDALPLSRNPDVVRLVELSHREAMKVGRSHNHYFRDDPGLGESIANEAVLNAAITWVEQRLKGSFIPWMIVYVRRRMIDEMRARYGRHADSPKRTTSYSLEYPLTDEIKLGDTVGRPDVTGLVDTLIEMEELRPELRWIVAATADGWKLREIGEVWGVSESRICQLLREARRKITR